MTCQMLTSTFLRRQRFIAADTGGSMLLQSWFCRSKTVSRFRSSFFVFSFSSFFQLHRSEVFVANYKLAAANTYLRLQICNFQRQLVAAAILEFRLRPLLCVVCSWQNPLQNKHLSCRAGRSPDKEKNLVKDEVPAAGVAAAPSSDVIALKSWPLRPSLSYHDTFQRWSIGCRPQKTPCPISLLYKHWSGAALAIKE